MLQSMRLQRAGHDLEAEQKQQEEKEQRTDESTSCWRLAPPRGHSDLSFFPPNLEMSEGSPPTGIF